LYSHFSKLDALELAATTAEFLDKCPCIVSDMIRVFIVNFFFVM